MNTVAEKFPASGMISLLHETPRYDLAESVGPDLRLEEVVEPIELHTLLKQPLGYGNPAGTLALRQAIAQPLNVDAGDIVVTLGGMQALQLIAQIATAGGGRVLASNPMFPLASSALNLTGARIESITLDFDHSYQLDLATISAKLSDDLCLIALASPQNPSGVALRRDAIEQLYSTMRKHSPNAFLLIDETYREACYGSDKIAKSMLNLGDRAITVTSLSKCHGAAGLRIGWAACQHPDFRAQLIQGKFNTCIACSGIDEMLALTILNKSDHILKTRRELLQRAVDLVDQWVSENSDTLEWVRPDAGALCCVRLRELAVPQEYIPDFYNALAQLSVRVAPGSWFGDTDRVFRLGFAGLPQSDLAPALARVTTAIQATVEVAA